MLCFKVFHSADATLAGIDTAHMIRKGQLYANGLTACQQFATLAIVNTLLQNPQLLCVRNMSLRLPYVPHRCQHPIKYKRTENRRLGNLAMYGVGLSAYNFETTLSRDINRPGFTGE